MGLLSSRNRRRVDAVERRAETLEAARKVGHLASYALAGGIGLAAAVGVTGFAGRYLATSPDFAVEDIRFTGLSHATESELVRVGGISRGQNLFTADLAEVERRLLQHPWVRSVYVSRELPHTLHVDVREWSPAAIVELGRLYLVSADGQVFRRLGAGDDFDLPVVTGIARDAFVDRREEAESLIRNALDAIAAYAPLAATEPLSEVHVNAGEGVSLRVGRDSLTVKLGSPPFAEKVSRLKRLVDEFQRANARAEVIHLENRARPGWVAVRFSSPGAYGPGR